MVRLELELKDNFITKLAIDIGTIFLYCIYGSKVRIP